jgi:hypothetical protein
VTRPLERAGGVFGRIHEHVVGPPVDMSDVDPDILAPELLHEARTVWSHRLRTEFRSIQIMSRFLVEVTGAGDPLDVYAGALELVRDEVRHAELCLTVCHALRIAPQLPDPVELRDPEGFLRAPMPERALHTALTMLAINETLSVGFIRDLATRCTFAPIRRVLDASLEDEAEHEAFGWSYVTSSLERFPRSTRASWRELVRRTLEPHLVVARPILRDLSGPRRSLEAWTDEGLIDLGLFSRERQALVFERSLRTLEPRLRELDLWPL